MKYLACFLLVLLLPTTVFAQTVIGAYSEAVGGPPCLLFDTPGLKTVYVMQEGSVGSSGSRFRVEFSPGFTGTLVSVTSPFAGVVGHPLTGVTVTYDGSCQTGTFEILELHVMLYGTLPECSWIRTAAHPLSIDGKLDYYTCSAQRWAANWEGTHIQHDWFPPCPDLTQGEATNYPPCLPYTDPLPTAAATWGAVKALYR